MKYCQGPKCHTYQTKDRLRGTKGNKTYQTRRRSSFYYLGGNACSMICQGDWFDKFGEQAVNHFGRIHDWGADNETYYTYNSLTKEERPITEEQYVDNSFTLNQG